MLEFIFKDENDDENCPLVVLTGADWKQDILRLEILGESDRRKIARALEADNFREGSAVFFADGRKISVITVKNGGDGRQQASLIYKAVKMQKKAAVVGGGDNALTAEKAARLALELERSAYGFDKYFTKKKDEAFPELETIYFPQLKKPENWKDTLALANGMRYARDLGNEPPNVLTPEVMALDLKRLEYLDIKVELLDRDFIVRHKLGLIEAVSRGSANKPYIAVMEWRGRPERKEWDLGLVGKGVTYDSGGISLKTDSQQIGEKKDMCGAAAVAAAMKTAALQKLPLNLIAVLPLVENMPNGNAYKPDDILTSFSGQTVEVVDTDGEGRLILADALWLAQEKYKVKTLVDMATLTGSTAYIFGGFYAALLGNDTALLAQVKEAAAQSGEKVWELPLEAEIDKRLKSETADMKNVGKREADSTQAACFLQRYIQKGVRWAHIDIAGCETDDKGMATGYGVLLLNHLMKMVSMDN